MKEGGTVAALLRQIRAERGESVRQTAKQVGVDPSYLSRVERGEKPITREFGLRLARHYELEPDEIGLALGEVPTDVVEILREHPEVISEIRQRFRGGNSARS